MDPTTGRTVASFASDITDGDYSAGSTHFRFAKMSNSAPTRAAMLGTNKIIGTIGSAAVAIAIPGSGTPALIGRTAVSSIPHITAPVPAQP